jgi:hypothetical protein
MKRESETVKKYYTRLLKVGPGRPKSNPFPEPFPGHVVSKINENDLRQGGIFPPQGTEEAACARAVGIFLKTGSHLATHTMIELFRMVADIPP